jgi:hypothetical protein
MNHAPTLSDSDLQACRQSLVAGARGELALYRHQHAANSARSG